MFKNCYHFSTEALEDKLLCYDEEDFRVVWNAIIICAAMEGITIYCFCIMSNHIHILLSGTEEQIRRFFAKFKQKTGRHFQARYNMHTARELSYKLFAVKDRRAFCQEVAYILRNPYKAGISSPFSYKWSTADAYFKPSDSSIQGRYVSDFPSKKLRTILKTRFPLPASLQIRSGRITSHSFVDYTFVEKMFDNSSLRFFNLIKTRTSPMSIPTQKYFAASGRSARTLSTDCLSTRWIRNRSRRSSAGSGRASAAGGASFSACSP